MKKLQQPLPPRNGVLVPFPIAYNERIRFRALSYPVRHLVRRYGLTASTALHVAELIGYAVGGDR